MRAVISRGRLGTRIQCANSVALIEKSTEESRETSDSQSGGSESLVIDEQHKSDETDSPEHFTSNAPESPRNIFTMDEDVCDPHPTKASTPRAANEVKIMESTAIAVESSNSLATNGT